MWEVIKRNPISSFAVFCVAVIAAFLGFMSYRLLTVLESSAWCAKAVQADKITPGNTFVGLTACVDLLKIQLQAVATGFHIGLGAYAFSLIVLIVVVVAGARASGKLPGGVEFNVSREEAVKTAAAAGAAAGVAAAATANGTAKP